MSRPAFFDGQILTADDLDAILAADREGRRRHNRDLHGWGIAAGLQVEAAAGDTSVRVAPGHALDAMGREVVVPEAVVLEIPPVAGAAGGGPAGYLLTVSYVADEDLVAVHRGGVCGSSGPVELAERALVRWQDPIAADLESRPRAGLDLVLAGALVKDCVLAAELDLALRVRAVAPPGAVVFAGATESGATSWRAWPDEDAAVGVVTTVDTSQAGFPDVPVYSARVAGDRVLDGPVVIDGHAAVASPTAHGFDLIVVLAGRDGPVPVNPAEIVGSKAFPGRLSSELGWSVVWLGVVPG